MTSTITSVPSSANAGSSRGTTDTHTKSGSFSFELELESYCMGTLDDYAAPNISLLKEGYDDRSRSSSVAGSERSEQGGTMGRINLPQNW